MYLEASSNTYLFLLTAWKVAGLIRAFSAEHGGSSSQSLSLTLFATSLSGHAVFIKEAFQDQSALAFATYSSITNKTRRTTYIAITL